MNKVSVICNQKVSKVADLSDEPIFWSRNGVWRGKYDLKEEIKKSPESGASPGRVFQAAEDRRKRLEDGLGADKKQGKSRDRVTSRNYLYV